MRKIKDCRQLEFAEYFLLAGYISGLNVPQSYVPMYSVYSCVLFICHEKNGKIKEFIYQEILTQSLFYTWRFLDFSKIALRYTTVRSYQ